MNGTFSCAKVVSNTIVLRLDADDGFLTYLRGLVKKSFSTSMCMRHSIFIFSRENERHRRKMFLTWAVNMLAKEYQSNKTSLLAILLRACDLSINIQISAKSSAVRLQKVYASFDHSSIIFRCYVRQAPFFSYVKSFFRGECDVTENLYELRLNGGSERFYGRLKLLLARKIILGFETYAISYSERELQRFLSAPSSCDEHMQKERTKRTLLAVLGIESECSIELVKRRYRELAKKYHPDMQCSTTLIQKEWSQKQFMCVKEAYERLQELLYA